MAKSKSTRAKAHKSSGDQPPTPAERSRAIRYLRKTTGGTHLVRPINALVQDTPAETIERCRRVVSWLAHIEQPFSDGELDAAEADILNTVVDALQYTETVLLSVGSMADGEVARG